MPSGTHTPSSSAIQCPSFVSASIPIASQNPAPRSACAPHTLTSALQAPTLATTDAHATVAVLPEIQSTPVPDIIEAVVPSCAHSSHSSSAVQGPSFVPIASQNFTPPVCAPHTTPTLQAQTLATTDAHAAVSVLPETKSTPVPDITESSPHSAVVWAQALEIAKRKLADNNLPPLDLTKLTSQSAEENIEAVMKALNTLQEDDKKKRWSYTRRGKKVIIVQRLGEILRSGEKYLKIVDIVIQSNQLSTFVWAGVRAMMQVSTLCTMFTQTILIPRTGRLRSCRSNRRF